MSDKKSVICTCDGGSIECEGSSSGCHCSAEACIFTCGDKLNTGFTSNVAIITTKHNKTKPDHKKDNLSIRSNGLPLGQVALMVNEGYDGEVLVPIGRIAESITLELKGSLEEICKTLGLTLQPKIKAYST